MSLFVKNYMKEGQKLPIYGVGPYITIGMFILTAIVVILIEYVFPCGILEGIWVWIFRITGGVLIVTGMLVWFIGAIRSDMDKNITENILKTDGIYGWVRNPMYSGWWLIITGTSFMWHNVWMLAMIIVNWTIMTVALKNTEEKWLKDLYGQEYEEYLKRVNRCIPWKRRNKRDFRD